MFFFIVNGWVDSEVKWNNYNLLLFASWQYLSYLHTWWWCWVACMYILRYWLDVAGISRHGYLAGLDNSLSWYNMILWTWIQLVVVAYQDFIRSRFGLQPANLEVSSKRSKEREPRVNGFVDIAWHLHHLRRPITNANLNANLTYLWPRIRYLHPLLWLGVFFFHFQELKEFYTWKLQMVAVGSMAQVPFWHLNSRSACQPTLGAYHSQFSAKTLDHFACKRRNFGNT